MTGLFTVLVEADDMDDPIADSVRSILDGHIILTRELATHNHYPAIDVLASVSRLSRDLLTEDQLDLAGRAREAMSTFRQNQDLINIGAYPAGSNPAIDRAITWNARLQPFLRQPVRQRWDAAESWRALTQAMETQTTPSSPTQPKVKTNPR